jgi:hypothetical protein
MANSAEQEPIIIGTDRNIPELVKLCKVLLATKDTFKRWQQAYSPLHSAYELGAASVRAEERERCANEVQQMMGVPQRNSIAAAIRQGSGR